MKDFNRKDVLISISIVVVTLMYFVDAYIPPDLKSFKVLGIEIGSFGFVAMDDLIFYSKMKFLVLFFCIIWYLSCIHWWKPAILVIIIIELSKLMTATLSDSLLDYLDYVRSLPFTVPIIIVLILISKKINNVSVSYNLRNDIDKEIDEVFFDLFILEKEELIKLKENFEKSKMIKNEFDSQTYLKILIELRNKFYYR